MFVTRKFLLIKNHSSRTREDDLKAMRKSSLGACFMTNLPQVSAATGSRCHKQLATLTQAVQNNYENLCFDASSLNQWKVEQCKTRKGTNSARPTGV